MVFRWVAVAPAFACIFPCAYAAVANDCDNGERKYAVTIVAETSADGSLALIGGRQVHNSSFTPPSLDCSTPLATAALGHAAPWLPSKDEPNEPDGMDPTARSFNSISVQVIGTENSDFNGGSIRIIVMPKF